MQEETKKFLKELLTGGYKASAIGMALALAIFVGFFFGFLLDRYFGTDYVFKIIGLIMGIIAGFRNVYYYGKKLEK